MGDLTCKALFAFDALADMPADQRQRELSGMEKKDPVLHRLLVALLAADATPHPLDWVSPEALLENLLMRRSASARVAVTPSKTPHALDE